MLLYYVLLCLMRARYVQCNFWYFVLNFHRLLIIIIDCHLLFTRTLRKRNFSNKSEIRPLLRLRSTDILIHRETLIHRLFTITCNKLWYNMYRFIYYYYYTQFVWPKTHAIHRNNNYRRRCFIHYHANTPGLNYHKQRSRLYFNIM